MTECTAALDLGKSKASKLRCCAKKRCQRLCMESNWRLFQSDAQLLLDDCCIGTCSILLHVDLGSLSGVREVSIQQRHTGSHLHITGTISDQMIFTQGGGISEGHDRYLASADMLQRACTASLQVVTMCWKSTLACVPYSLYPDS